MLLGSEDGPLHDCLGSEIATHTIDSDLHQDYLTSAALRMAASILSWPLCFAPSDEFSCFLVAATLAYPVGEFACSALRACTRIHEAQAVMGTPFITAGFRSLALWHAHMISTLTTSSENGVVGVKQNADRPRLPDRHTVPHSDSLHTPGTSPHSRDDTRAE